MNKQSIIGLIPARSGSKRCPNKNTRPLAGHPLIAWTIKSALESRIFTDIVVSTDSQETMEIASSYGASAILRPSEISQDTSTDYEWVTHAIKTLDCKEDAFGILRPTNPFRTAETIKACWNKYKKDPLARSLRTVRPVVEHPHKMWSCDDGIYLWACMNPEGAERRHINCDLPFHNLRTYYIQDGLFYINQIDNIIRHGRLTDDYILPYFTTYPENLDINTEQDFLIAQENAWILKK